MYDHIVLPTDGSPGTADAVDEALDLASHFDAALTVLYVVDNSVLPLDSITQSVFDELEDEARRSLEAVLERATERGIDPVSSRVLRGVPHTEILEFVRENDVDLVVMGTHGRTGLDRILLGSVTERVLRLAKVPVLTVPLREAPTETAPESA